MTIDPNVGNPFATTPIADESAAATAVPVEGEVSEVETQAEATSAGEQAEVTGEGGTTTTDDDLDLDD